MSTNTTQAPLVHFIEHLVSSSHLMASSRQAQQRTCTDHVGTSSAATASRRGNGAAAARGVWATVPGLSCIGTGTRCRSPGCSRPCSPPSSPPRRVVPPSRRPPIRGGLPPGWPGPRRSAGARGSGAAAGRSEGGEPTPCRRSRGPRCPCWAILGSPLRR